MKKVLFLNLVVLLFIACQPKGPVRYTQNSPEIDAVKKHIANYNNKNYDTGIYADTSKTFLNTRKKAMSPSEAMDYHKQNDVNYSSRGFKAEDQEYEMVVTDDGETWVNCWLDWKGTLAATGQEIEIPIHLTYRFVESKVVRELGYWDPTEIVLALQQIEAQKNSSEEEEEKP
ncbi:nuclear transport factor 2 family protein [Ulvibacterium sp.]|uniref:nuclear transport factor 2 family protein n=1 Tax=Ulvibacterium sp. TaxID=2665914 RepID=UPI003BA96F6A